MAKQKPRIREKLPPVERINHSKPQPQSAEEMNLLKPAIAAAASAQLNVWLPAKP